jgi:hypothetical protein
MNGAIIGAVFGCAWGIAGAMALPTPWRAWTTGFCIGVSFVLTLAHALPHKHRSLDVFRGRIYGMTVAFQVAAIFATIWLLRQLALPRLLMPAIGFIVGLHFLGLWKATHLRVFLGTALTMCVVCAVAVLLPGAPENGNVDLRRFVTGLGSALVLWGASAWSLLKPGG